MGSVDVGFHSMCLLDKQTDPLGERSDDPPVFFYPTASSFFFGRVGDWSFTR